MIEHVASTVRIDGVTVQIDRVEGGFRWTLKLDGWNQRTWEREAIRFAGRALALTPVQAEDDAALAVKAYRALLDLASPDDWTASSG